MFICLFLYAYIEIYCLENTINLFIFGSSVPSVHLVVFLKFPILANISPIIFQPHTFYYACFPSWFFTHQHPSFFFPVGNLYFTNAFVYETLIEVIRINTTYRRVLLKVSVDMPRHIVVDPKHRYLFWADYGQKPKIERSFLDCTNRTVLVSEGIVTPRGLAVDHDTGYIYWVDDSLDIIARIHRDGGESQVVRYGSRYPTPYGITVFGESIIWVDRNLRKVFQASKQPGNTDPPTVIRDSINLLRDVTIFDEHVQPLSPAELNNNPCLQSNGGCSHFCFALPELPTPKCGCAFGTLEDDGKNCATSREDFLIYSLNNSLRSLHFDPQDHNLPFQAISVEGMAIALDYDRRNNRIFFTQKLNPIRGQISYVNLYSGASSPTILLSSKRTPGLGFTLALDIRRATYRIVLMPFEILTSYEYVSFYLCVSRYRGY
jgi:low density lipoprotein-related protein 2